MNYITVYRTLDRNEISIIKNLFDQSDIEYQVPDEVTNDSAGIAGLGGRGMRVQVSKKDENTARSILTQAGFVGEREADPLEKHRKPATSKIVYFLLALLIVVLAIMLLIWFMNPET